MGKYVVTLAPFEDVAVAIVEALVDGGGAGADVVVVDEIGKMELLSPHFGRAMRALLLGAPPPPAGAPPPPPRRRVLLCTVASKGGGLVADAKARAAARGALVEVTAAHRGDALVDALAARVAHALRADDGAAGQGSARDCRARVAARAVVVDVESSPISAVISALSHRHLTVISPSSQLHLSSHLRSVAPLCMKVWYPM